MKARSATLAAAVAATFGGGSADAATWNVQLTTIAQYNNSANSGYALNITSSTATFSYDDVTQLLAQTGGTVNARLNTAPTSTLFRHSITGLVMGNGGATSAASFVCTEGNFGGNVGASICGNYSFGANFTSESTTTWGPGTAVSRTVGGDDFAAGPQESIATYDSMTTVSWDGSALVLRNATCTGPCTTLPAGKFNNGYRWNLTVVPIPAAAWLFGGALGLLGVVRRRSGV